MYTLEYIKPHFADVFVPNDDSFTEFVATGCSAPTASQVSIADPRRDDCPLIAVSDEFLTMTGYLREEVVGPLASPVLVENPGETLTFETTFFGSFMTLFVVGHLPGAGKNCRFLNRANDALIEPFLCKISCDWETWQNILFAQLLNPTNDLNTKGVRYFARLSLLRQLLFGTEDLQRLTKSLQNRCSVHRSHTQSKKIRCRKGGGEVMGKGKAPRLLVKMKLRGCEGFSDFRVIRIIRSLCHPSIPECRGVACVSCMTGDYLDLHVTHETA